MLMRDLLQSSDVKQRAFDLEGHAYSSSLVGFAQGSGPASAGL
jgi:hypothetical protein